MGQEKPIQERMSGQVPVEIIEEANLLDEARRVHAEATRLEGEAATIRERLGVRFNEGVRELATTEELNPDEFIEKYAALLLTVNQASMQVQNFFKMMNLRKALTPGTVFKTSEGRFFTVVDSEDGVEIQPRLVQYGSVNGFELRWHVPIQEGGRILLDEDTETNRDAIIEELDTRYYGRGIFSSQNVFSAIGKLRKLGEEGKAQKLQDELVDRINKSLSSDVFTPRPDLDKLRENLRVLEEIDKEAYDDFIATAKKHAANGKFRPSVLYVVELHADLLKRDEAIKNGKTDYYGATELEVAQQYVTFVHDGIEILEEAQKVTASV